LEESHFWSLTELAGRLRRREASSLEITRHLLGRIDHFEPRLHSYVTVMSESALNQARRADEEIDRGYDRGPLHGVPIAIKDIFYTADAPTTAGSTFLEAHTPRWNATVVEKLNKAGAVLLGKLATTEGALSEHRPDRPAPKNPWNVDYWAGFSSSGSGVATAAGLCYASVGTDTGGSIRMPSSACGLSGMKPTWGRVSRHGLFPLCESRDHVGPMARSAADAAAMLGAIAGHDTKDATSLPQPPANYLGEIGRSIGGLRLGVDREALTAGVDPAIAEALKQAVATFEGLGMRVREVQFPSPVEYLKIYFAATVSEVALAHAATFPAHADKYGTVLRRTLEAAASAKGTDVIKVEHEKLKFCGQLANLFEDVDVLLLPVFTMPTQTCEEMAKLTDPAEFILTRGRFTIPFNASGNPAFVLPCGVSANGMPLSMQLVGRHLDEATLFRAGHAYQQVTDWHTRHPALD
jgi:amidase